MPFSCIRLCIRQQSRSISPLHQPLFSRNLSSAPPKSTYYVQSFVHQDEQYILLLSHSSIPMGRIRLSTPPPRKNLSTTGPTAEYFDPISPETIKADWTTFMENSGFRDILQSAVKENIAQEEMIINDANSLQGGNGWIHLCDERALPA